TTRGLAFGLFDAVTPQVTGVSDLTVEPMTNYAVLRGQQDLRGGETSISFIGTGVNRQLDDLTRPLLHSSAYTAGATFRNRFHDPQHEIAGQVAASRLAGSAEAM